MCTRRASCPVTVGLAACYCDPLTSDVNGSGYVGDRICGWPPRHGSRRPRRRRRRPRHRRHAPTATPTSTNSTASSNTTDDGFFTACDLTNCGGKNSGTFQAPFVKHTLNSPVSSVDSSAEKEGEQQGEDTNGEGNNPLGFTYDLDALPLQVPTGTSLEDAPREAFTIKHFASPPLYTEASFAEKVFGNPVDIAFDLLSVPMQASSGYLFEDVVELCRRVGRLTKSIATEAIHTWIILGIWEIDDKDILRALSAPSTRPRKSRFRKGGAYGRPPAAGRRPVIAGRFG